MIDLDGELIAEPFQLFALLVQGLDSSREIRRGVGFVSVDELRTFAGVAADEERHGSH
jgi:hypothetical protein